jgi:hypothetical protein
MSQQIQITGGAKVRALEGVITGTSGVLSSVPLGAANGVATLDSGGKVPVSQLPSSVVTYLGTWNAATNFPTLTNGTGDAGDMYLCNVAGTVNFGAGPITFAVGDWVLYGSGTWQKSNGQNGTVTSVAASITGTAIGLTGSPITTAGTLAFAFAGTNLEYVNGAGNLTTFPSLTGFIPYTGATTAIDLNAKTVVNISHLGINTTSVPTILIRAVGDNNSSSRIAMRGYSSDANSSSIRVTKFRGTVGAPQAPQSGDSLGKFELAGYGTTSSDGYPQASFEGLATESWGATARGTKVVIKVTPNTTITQAVALTINQDKSAVFENSITATSLIKTGGTSSQYLMADGSTSTLTNPITGTGTSGQVAYFNGTSSLTSSAAFTWNNAFGILYVTGTGVGYVSLSKGTASNTGFIDFYNSAGVRAGYIGYSTAANTIGYNANFHVFNANYSSNNPLISLNQTFVGAFSYMPFVQALAPNITNGSILTVISGGKATSVNNNIVISYSHISDGSTSNRGSLGIAGSGNIFNWFASGNVAINTTTDAGFRLDVNGTARVQGQLTLSSTISNGTYTYTLPSATGTLALTSDISYPVTSVFGRTGAVVATSGDYTTTQVTEGTNLYYTDVRARASLSFVAGSGAYNSTTGVITIPTDNSQIANGAGYITSSALSGYLPLTGGTLTGALNINASSGTAMNVAGNAIFRGDTGVGTPRQLIITSGGSTPVYLEAKGYGANYQTDFGIRTYNNVGTAFEVFYADSSGRVGINQVSPSYQLDVNGTGRFSGALTGTSASFSSSVTAGTGGYLISGDNHLKLNCTVSQNQQIQYQNNGTNKWQLYLNTSDNSFNFYNSAQSSSNLTIASTGASSFSSSVTAKADLNSYVFKMSPNTDTIAAGNYTEFLMAMRNTGDYTGSIRLISKNASGSYLAPRIGFYLVPEDNNSYASMIERLSILGNGNVGIGTSIPTAITGFTSVCANNATTGAFFEAQQGGTVLTRFGGQSDIAFIDTVANIPFIIKTNSTERMRITSGGNVGIGTTTPDRKLQVNGDVTLSGENYIQYNRILQWEGFSYWTLRTQTTGADFQLNNGSAGVAAFTIKGNNNFLIGTTTDEGYKLYVNGGSSSGMLFYSTSAANQIKAAGTAPAITFSNTITSPTIGGSLGACTSAGQFLSGTAAGDMILINQFTGNKLYITNYSGGVYLTQGATSWTANSDIRLKNINSHIENAVEKLSTLQTINFSYKDDKFNKQNLGLIAQEVEKIFPELIDKNGDGMLGVRYTELVPVLIKAVQELKAEIETLKNK